MSLRATFRQRVIAARHRQQQRFAAKPRITCNARMGSRELKAYCALDEHTLDLLNLATSGANKPLPPLAGLNLLSRLPTANAMGYFLAPLRGWIGQLALLRSQSGSNRERG